MMHFYLVKEHSLFSKIRVNQNVVLQNCLLWTVLWTGVVEIDDVKLFT